MIATQTLRHEHEAILKMLEATEEVSRRLQAFQPVSPETLEGLQEFFREFADHCHHGKEEDLLFPFLEQKGIPRGGGPIGMMLYEHEQGRALIREMGEAAAAYREGEDGSGPRWARAAGGYAHLLREHIAKENNVLFVMAERLLSPEEQDRLGKQFEAIELEKMGAGTHERLHARMEELLGSIWQRVTAR
jgi:hemerythrin-like domain-containing protein